jgi:hypothetical protein
MDELVYPVGTRVRLTDDLGDARTGAEGVVIGYYRREPPAYAVKIEGRPVAIPPALLDKVAGSNDD